MSSPVALILGGTSVYWSGIIIAVGIGAGFLLTYALYTAHSGRGECLWMVFALSLLIGLIFSRLVHFFYNREQYRGLVSALSDFSPFSPSFFTSLMPSVASLYILLFSMMKP